MSAPAPILEALSGPHAPAAATRARRRRIKSHLLGDLAVPADAVLEFPDGLFGFPSCKEWVLVATERAGWCWLHSAEHPALAFLLVDPFTQFPAFAVDLTAQDLAVLGVSSATQVAVFAIVTLPRAAGDAPTVNLSGPVAIALPSRRGRQLVLNDARFDARTALAQVPGGADDTDS
ncbi:MAG: flagellar assembly protein FliW [Gemmatimonadaceae bacterium]|nr:flagellar assembly protein FliW [Gemmatimonadaceae bacterium]